MKQQTSITRLIGILSASALMLSATIIPAEASKPSAASECPNGYLCLFDGTSYAGAMIKLQNDADLDNYGWRDRAESLVNKTAYSVTFTDEHWYGDEHTTIPAYFKSDNMDGWRNVVDRVNIRK